ncbi:MAG TPA: hypothetical protein VLC92_13980 [Rhodocyclaceae bacterium]|nr:hypothetical protein [Rhodocyclaceae bacterium]
MNKTPVLAAALAAACAMMLSACSLPGAAPTLTLHDLGGVFPQGSAKSPVALRSVQVIAQPIVATFDMQYREASQPTRRGKYGLNRWAATPASMVEAALARQLAPQGSGRCRLQYSLGEFIIEVAADGQTRALLVADAIVLRDAQAGAGGGSLRQGFDVSVPMREASPAGGAIALREAVIKLAENSASWLSGEPSRFCAG